HRISRMQDDAEDHRDQAGHDRGEAGSDARREVPEVRVESRAQAGTLRRVHRVQQLSDLQVREAEVHGRHLPEGRRRYRRTEIASRGVHVALYEMRPVRPTAVHKTDGLAELVCSNSFRGDKLDNAVGLLKEEMRRLGSLIMRAADETRVPAGAALAVDRDRFSS